MVWACLAVFDPLPRVLRRRSSDGCLLLGSPNKACPASLTQQVPFSSSGSSGLWDE